VSNAATTIDSPAAPNRGTAHDPHAARPRRRGRTAITITLVVALLCSAVLQQVAFSVRSKAINRNRPDADPAASRLANLDSFSLALLLGGLRGPLVMFLWTQSESQKTEKDLESFGTQVELIRLLQPEFATVHLFQIWNLAYNISVQMASLSNKYASILDAVEYARRTDRMSPNDINIISALGGLYADKLGNSAEKEYYRRRVRTETLPVYRVMFPRPRVDEFKKAAHDAGLDETRIRIDTTGDPAIATLDKLGGDRVLASFTGPGVTHEALPRQSLRPESRTGRRTEMDTLLDEKGYLLPQYLKPTVNLPPGTPGNNGAELQYLEQFQPYPYGLSPFALGYNYYKRAQALYRYGHQKHIQLGDMVIDDQPALTLRVWSDEELDRGRRLEQQAFPNVDNDKLVRELRTAKIAPDTKPTNPGPINAAIYSYDQAARTAGAAVPEFEAHIERFPSGIQNFGSHIQNARAVAHLAAADAAYLRAVIAPSADARKADLDKARTEYREALRHYEILVLGYYVIDADAATVGYSRAALPTMTPEQVQALMDKFNQLAETKYKGIQNSPSASDIQEYTENMQRIQQRLGLIK
jgi:hypothetical protein